MGWRAVHSINGGHWLKAKKRTFGLLPLGRPLPFGCRPIEDIRLASAKQAGKHSQVNLAKQQLTPLSCSGGSHLPHRVGRVA